MADWKYHITNFKDYQRYLDDQMTPKERHDFEKRLLDDEFASEAMEGLSQQDTAEIITDLDLLKYKFHKRTKKKENNAYWRIAAALLLLGSFSFVVYYTIDFNPTNEVAQSGKAPTTEEIEKMEESVVADSAKEPETPIIAYQQEFKKEGKAEKPSQQIIEAQEPAVVEKDIERIVIADAVEEVEDEDDVLGVAESVEISELTLEEEAEVAETAVDERKFAEAVPHTEILTAAPAAAKKIESTTARKQKAARSAKTKTITGKVSSLEDGEELPGVNIIVKGTDVGAVSDVEGNYAINVPKEEDVTLVYSYIGFSTEEVKVKDKVNIDVNIEPDITALSEIVVVGYATQEKSNVSGAVSTISSDEINEYDFIPPRPEGGTVAFKEYIKENIRYPESRIEEKIKGTVKLKFTVGVYGRIINLEVLKSLGEDFDLEAIRLVNEGPKWEPAKENDSFVVREVKVKIRFRPPN